ncbi:TPA: DUF1858 domain-containing protein [Candidatus Galligastranaerophilus intestinigallinarum]|nr:DUF1858 domain-containing protein [Candidatus Galligastranaerophilus intestinigallinarum]
MGKITKEMSIIDVVQQHPETLEVFQKFGLGCIGCAAARFENLEAGAKVHGIDPEVMVQELNNVIETSN